MTDKKEAQEVFEADAPIEGQYTIEEVLHEAHERRLKMQEDEPKELDTPEDTRLFNFLLQKMDELLTDKSRMDYEKFVEQHPDIPLENYISSLERRLFLSLTFLGQGMTEYIKAHPEETLESIWENKDPDSPAWQFMKKLSSEWVGGYGDRAFEELYGDQPPQKQNRDKRSKAIEQGALMSIGSRLASYSAKGFENSLNTPAIFGLPDEAQEVTKLFDQRGQLNIAAMQGRKLTQLTKLHTAFLMALNQAAIVAAGSGLDQDNGGLMKVYLPTFCREIGLDARGYSDKRSTKLSLEQQRVAAILDLLQPLESYVGRTPDGVFWRLAAFHSYDPASDTMTFSAPYLYELRKAEALQGKTLNQLLHGSVVNEPNWSAVELANRILDGLLSRGTSRPDSKTYTAQPRKQKETKHITKADGSKETQTTIYIADPEPLPPADQEPRFTYRARFKYLIKGCPQFSQELETILAGEQINPRTGEKSKSKPATAYNMKLKNTFEAAIKIIMEKSDAPLYFVDLDISPKHPKTGKFMPPTKTALTHELTITHKGKNKDYHPVDA